MDTPSVPAHAPVEYPETLETVDVALQMGALLLGSGASTARAVRVMRDVLAALGQPNATVIVTPEQMTAAGSAGKTPYSLTRPPPQIGWHVTRFEALEALADRVVEGPIDPRQLRAELPRIEALPPLYNRWMVIVALGCVGASMSRILGADRGGTGAAFFASVVGQYVYSEIGGRTNLALTTLVSATLAALIGALTFKFGLHQTPPPTLTASVVFLFPGMWLVTGGIDIIGGRQIRAGLYRVTVAFLLFLAIVLGVYLGVVIAS